MSMCYNLEVHMYVVNLRVIKYVTVITIYANNIIKIYNIDVYGNNLLDRNILFIE